MHHTPAQANHLSQRQNRQSRLAVLSALMLGLALTACGGGGSDQAPAPAPDPAPAPSPAPGPTPAPPAGPPLASGTAALAGDWVSRKVCTPLGGNQSAYQMVRIAAQSDTVVNYQSGTLLFAMANCQGNGTALVSPVGTVTFTRIESNAAIAAHWGAWRTVTGTTSYVAWAKPADNKLCLLGDESPSILPTLDSVAQSASVSDQQNACYIKL